MSAFVTQYVVLPSPVRPSHSIAFVRTDAPWGLARVSSRTRLSNQNPINLNYTYEYDSPAGNGVDIYVLDTGLLFLIRFYHKMSQYLPLQVSTSSMYVRVSRVVSSDANFRSLTSAVVLHGELHSARTPRDVA